MAGRLHQKQRPWRSKRAIPVSLKKYDRAKTLPNQIRNGITIDVGDDRLVGLDCDRKRSAKSSVAVAQKHRRA